ncbi:MAG: DNA polymerase III subunit delta' [Planctomycetota bacterium]
MRLCEIQGHVAAIRILHRLLAAGRLPSALILAGAPGIGRRTLALAVAQSLLCREPCDGDACGECESCHLVAAGNHPDLEALPPDTAVAHIDVRTVRDEIVARAGESPLMGQRRAFVLPAVERLRGPAANALLKVLEEPPAGAHFLLTSGYVEGLLPTIRSRSQIIRLQPLDRAEVERVLLQRGLDMDVARTQAAMAGGSVRGALDAASAAVPMDALLALVYRGFDARRVHEVLTALEEACAERGSEATPAQQQRQVLGLWFEALLQRLRADLRGAAPMDAATAIERVRRLQRDLAIYLPVRLVVEGVGLG